MSSLKQRIAQLANEFAENVLRELKRASIDEILAEGKAVSRPSGKSPAPKPAAKPKSKGGGRLPRRSQADIDRAVEQIVTLLLKHPLGLRADQIRDALHLDERELPKPLTDAVQNGRIAKRGNKRSTIYLPPR